VQSVQEGIMATGLTSSSGKLSMLPCRIMIDVTVAVSACHVVNSEPYRILHTRKKRLST